jgi:hypothetical protein
MQTGVKKVANVGVVILVFLIMGKTLQRRRLVGDLATMVELKK